MKPVRLLCYMYTVEPHYFKVPREMEKKFEIVEFRNNWGSLKLVTMNHFLIKYVCNHQRKFRTLLYNVK